MSASYQCPNCGQIVPVIDLDEAGPVRCPSCQGALRSGPPPVSRPPSASNAHIVQPIPPWRAEPSVPARWDDEDAADVYIRRREMLPVGPPPAAQSSGRGKHVVWPLIVVGIAVLRLVACGLRHDQPQAPQFDMPQMQFQMPNAGGLDQPPGEVLIQRASWSEQLADGLLASRLILSGPINPRIGVVAADRAAAETTFIGFDGDTGAKAGRIVWKAPIRPLRFSLSDDGSRLAVLLQDGGQATKRIQIYALPGGNAVGEPWYPFPQANAAAANDVWFEMLGPDRMLTIFQHRQLELWSVPDGKRLYTVGVEPAPGDSQHAVAISPNRRLVAVANATWGFTFHDTATGAIQGRTAAVAGKVTELANCAFSPGGRQFGCQLTVHGAEPRQEKWVMWSCPNGAIEANWDMQWDARVDGRGWLFWDDENVLFYPGQFARAQLLFARDGKLFASVDTEEARCLPASTGRRLWYVCTERFPPGNFAFVPAVQVASIELQPQWFQNPVPNDGLFRQWYLKPEGLSIGR